MVEKSYVYDKLKENRNRQTKSTIKISLFYKLSHRKIKYICNCCNLINWSSSFIFLCYDVNTVGIYLTVNKQLKIYLSNTTIFIFIRTLTLKYTLLELNLAGSNLQWIITIHIKC